MTKIKNPSGEYVDIESYNLAMDALREIAKGAGPYSRDPLTHASNTIDAMRAIAKDALAAIKSAESK